MRDAEERDVSPAAKRRDTYYIIAILVSAIAVYANTLFNGFVYDDRYQLLENPVVLDLGNLPTVFTTSAWNFKGAPAASNFYRPVMYVFYMLTCAVFGLAPWAFHLVNVAVHAAASVVVFHVSKRLLALSAEPQTSAGPAFVAALLFATTPLNTEAVAWVAALPELTYTLFCLLSLYCYIRYRDGQLPAYLLSVVFFALAALSKEPALTLPLVLLAYDALAMKRVDGQMAMIRRQIPYGMVVLGYLGLRLHALGGFAPLKPHRIFSSYEYVINLAMLFGQYAAKLVFPASLNAYHLMRPAVSILDGRVIASLIVAVCLGLSAIILVRRRNTAAILGLLLLLLPLLPVLYAYPTLGIVFGEGVFGERYLYLPSFGFYLALAAVLGPLLASGRRRAIAGALVALVLSVYAMSTVMRNLAWKDDYTLFSDIVAKSPRAAYPHYALANAMAERGGFDEASRELMAAIRIKPDFAPAHYNLGVLFVREGRYDAAASEFETAIRISPDYANACLNLGFVYAVKDRKEEAERLYHEALRIDPANAGAHTALGNLYTDAGRIDEAIDEYSAALAIDPNDREAAEQRDLLERMRALKR